MAKLSRSGPRKSEPECRPLRPEEFEADGLPKGRLELAYTTTTGLLPSDTSPRWLARYGHLPAYLGAGTTPADAVVWLQKWLTPKPVFRVRIKRFKEAELVRQLKRGFSLTSAQAEIGEGKRSSDYVSFIAKTKKVRPADVLHAIKSRERHRWLTGQSVPQSPGPEDIHPDNIQRLAETLVLAWHPWEWEWSWAARRLPIPGSKAITGN